MESEHKLAIMTPLNGEGAAALSWEAEFDEKNFLVMEISREQYDGLFWLFDRFNSEFNLLIDRFEEETLPPERLERAIEITAEFSRTAAGDASIAALRELSSLLSAAKALNSQVLFAF